MTARQQWSIVAAVVVFVALGLGAAMHFMKDDLFIVNVGATAPNFRAKELNSTKYKTLADYKGQVVLLNVWGTFCPPCIKEMPSLEQLHREYGPKGLKIVAVSIDDAVSEDSIRAYANNLGISFEILHDSTHAIERVYQTTGYPETFVIGPEGTIRKKWWGADNWASQGNRALIAQLLGRTDTASDDRNQRPLTQRMPGTPTLRPQSSMQRRVIAAFTERLMLKATAVLLAIILWLVVNAKEPQIELVAVRFTPVLLDSSLVLRDQLPQFQAIVAGSPKELIKLNSALPTIRRQITADAPDTLVVDLRPEDVVLPEGVDAVVRDVQPRSLTLRFEPTWTRRVRIASTGIQVITLPGVPLVRPQFDPETVQISGPRHLVIRIAQVQTVKTTIPYPDSLAHLVDIDTTALGASVRVKPAQVKVHLP